MGRLQTIASWIPFEFGLLRGAQFNTRIISFKFVNERYFEKQMKYLLSHYRVVSLKEALSDLNKKQVVVTFDIGYKCLSVIAFSVLKQLKIKPTLFLAYDLIDKNTYTWWDRLTFSRKKINIEELKLMDPKEIERRVQAITGLDPTDVKDPDHDFLTWEEIKQMKDVFEFGSMAMTHPLLSHMTAQAAEKEIKKSKRMLEKKFKTIDYFSYPNGDFNKKIMEMVRVAGYRCALTYEKGNNDKSTNRYCLHRTRIRKEDNLAVFAAKVAGML